MKSIKEGIRRLLLGVRAQHTIDYQSRLTAEHHAYVDCTDVHDLPEIFHYWSNRYLVPMMEPFGFTSPDQFFIKYLLQLLDQSNGESLRLLSIGAGNCELEVKLADQLRNSGATNFAIECLDLNQEMLKRGSDLAQSAGVDAHLCFTHGDFNYWRSGPDTLHAVIANQTLHHVLKLERLFDEVHRGLKLNGKFLISDMIGRNGHMRWPEALQVVSRFWGELPESYRYNRLLKQQEHEFVNHDCSTEGFEGIRAQDILPLLVERFHFDFFLPYGNIIFPFIDRAFGHNFNASNDWDRNFIDRVHRVDEDLLLNGTITPTSMLAVLGKVPVQTQCRHPSLTPEACIRVP